MKTEKLKKIGTIVLMLPFLCMCKLPKGSVNSFSKYVTPIIGSGGHGHVFVGANVPFGMVQVGPNNIYKGWDWCSGYHYSDSIITGFSHTHLSGTGGADLGDILIMPITGKVYLDKGKQDDISKAYSSKFKHKNETVKAGYYSVLLDKYNILAELTATERVGIHRYTFPDQNNNHVIIDLKEGICDKAYETYLEKVDDYTLMGYRFSRGWAKNQQIWFALVSNNPIEKIDLYDNNNFRSNNVLKAASVKGVLKFKGNPRKVILKVGISPVSSQNALANIKAEATGENFDQFVQEAQEKWNNDLSKIEITTGNEKLKQIFYTALYHTAFAPVLFNDADGTYRGTDKKVYKNPGFENYTIFSLWDTYRTEHELITLIHPERVNDIIKTMLTIYQQQGRLPQWHLWGNETNAMSGYSAAPVLVDAYEKGFRDYDSELAFEALKESATHPRQRGIPALMEYGFSAKDKAREATSVGLENAVDDRSVAQMAKDLGKTDEFNYFFNRSEAFKKLFDKRINFFRPKFADGSWKNPYNPIEAVHMVGDFSEGNGWQYTWLVPQAPEELIELMGGDKAFTGKLDSFFVVTGDMGEHASIDISGLIGMYAQGNEPCHHIAYLYAYAGQQWKTAEKIRFILNKFYTNQPDGLIGNEDCGQMSAWYVMSALGLYQVNPSNGIFIFGSPLFDKSTIHLPQGKTFTIDAENNSDKNIYIQSATLNGVPYSKSYISYQDIMKGGKLNFVMGAKPNYKFGAAKNDRPKSDIK